MSMRLLLLLLLACCLTNTYSATAPKNVLLIMADDLRDYGGAFTKSIVKTSNLDRLRKRGVTFDLAFAQYPVCNPSRSSMFTGLRCERTGIVGNDKFLREALPEVVTLPQLLRQQGWAAHSFGKIYHTANTGEAQRGNWLDLGKSWDHAETIPPVSPHRRGDFHNITGGKLPWCEIGIVDGPDEEQPDGQTASKAIQSVKELTSKNKPWFIAAGFHRPHDPFHSPRKYFDLYPKDKLKLYSDPAGVTNTSPLAIPGGWKETFSKFDDTQRREFLQAYLAGVSFMDAQVGRLLDTLDQMKLWENTMVIFMGDHGYHLGEREWWNKNTLFDRSCRAPLVIAAPGVEGGQVYSAPVEFLDIYPTVAEFCGVIAPKVVAGKSLLPVLKDTTSAHKPAAFTLVTRGNQNFGQSARTKRWRYTQWSNGSAELYDHSIDPEETVNVASIPKNRAIVAEHKKHLEELPPWPRR